MRVNKAHIKERNSLFKKGLKKCTKCNTEKSLDKFNNQSGGIFGKTSHCQTCTRETDKARSEYRKTQQAEYRLVNKESRKCKYYVKTFGITLNKYNEMYQGQEGRCKICNIHQDNLDRSLAVDHCHKNGNVRGLLCKHCNMGIGSLKDNIELLKTAIKYLEGDK